MARPDEQMIPTLFEHPPSPHNRVIVLLIALFVGFWGIHRMMVGKVGTGILYFFTGGLFGIGWAYDIFMLAVGGFEDAQGRLLRDTVPPHHQLRSESAPLAPPARERPRRRRSQARREQPAPKRNHGTDGSVDASRTPNDRDLMLDPLEEKFKELERQMRDEDGQR